MISAASLRERWAFRFARALAAPLFMLALGLLPLQACAQSPSDAPASSAPISDPEFAALVDRLSEPGGYFDTDNLISNEGSYLHVMGGLRDLGVRGGAYVGVGPDQNFSYIAQVRPSIAIIADIRRDNLLEHLLFKALFHLSADRAEYLSLLLGRPSGAPGATAPIDSIVAYLDRTPMSPEAYTAAHRRVVERIRGFGVAVDSAEWRTIERFHRAFAVAGLDLKFESFGRAPQSYYPDLRQLVLERDLAGDRASFLSSEDAFQGVRALQLQNRVIPVVSDLAGVRAMGSIASFLEERGERVSAYYVSNADFYIVQDGKLDRFIENLRALPLRPDAVIIRSVFRTGFAGAGLPSPLPGYRSVQSLQSASRLLTAYEGGRVRGYADLISTGLLTSAPR